MCKIVSYVLDESVQKQWFGFQAIAKIPANVLNTQWHPNNFFNIVLNSFLVSLILTQVNNQDVL